MNTVKKTANNDKPVNRYNWISTLRGFAALLVFTAHLPIPMPDPVSFAIGRTGVAIFFLIMGYLAVQSRARRTRKQYLFNRFVRMYPVFWLILLATYIVKVIAWKADFIRHLKDLLLNMTLFNELLGSDCIIGTSWMMPIQVCFFILLALLPPDFFDNKEDRSFGRTELLFIAGGIGTLAMALAKRYMDIPSPTAFGLLILLGYMAVIFHQQRKRTVMYIIMYIIIFVPSVILSYRQEADAYAAAYALGIAIFALAAVFKPSFGLLNKLGDIGFSFFLAADIPHIILEKFISTNDSPAGLAAFIVIKLAASLVLAYLLTRYIEQPMLKKAKDIEQKL